VKSKDKEKDKKETERSVETEKVEDFIKKFNCKVCLEPIQGDGVVLVMLYSKDQPFLLMPKIHSGCMTTFISRMIEKGVRFEISSSAGSNNELLYYVEGVSYSEMFRE